MPRHKIEFKFAECGQRLSCTVCGGNTEKELYAEAVTDSDIRVCMRCLQNGDIDKRLTEHAALLEAYAAEVRALIGCLRVPSWTKYCTERACLHQDYLEGYARNGFEEAIERFKKP
jgi:hypothetical protein